MQNSSSVNDAQAQSLPIPKRFTRDNTAQKNWKPRWGFIKTVVLVAILLYGVILIVPLFLAFFYSFTDLNPLYPNTTFVGLQNYADMFKDADFIGALSRTIVLSLNVTILANVAGLAVAIMLNRPGRFYALLRTLFFIPQVLSGVIVGFIWAIILTTNNGILNILLQQLGLSAENIAWLGKPGLAFLALTVVIIWQQMGFCVVVYLAALHGIPQDLIEAATIDGANRWGVFRNITFPLLAPGMTVNVVLLLIISLKIYDQVAVLTAGGPGGQTETLAYYIIRLTFTSNEAGYGSAVALVLFCLIAITSVILTGVLRKREVEF